MSSQVYVMSPEPIYRASDLRAAYQLRYGWTGWPSDAPFSTELVTQTLPYVAPDWEKDGIRLLESNLAPEKLQLTLSTRPHVDPITLAARVKGRLQHHCRKQGTSLDFSRKVAVRSLGDATRADVEGYVRQQVAREHLADERFREMLTSFTVVNPQVDLSLPTATNSGRYWYNLHLVLVTEERYRMGEPETLGQIRDGVARICVKKGYAASVTAVMPDHVHVALRGALDHSPETIALSFLNNLAYIVGQKHWWQAGYYAGTFGEYSMAAVRSKAGNGVDAG